MRAACPSHFGENDGANHSKEGTEFSREEEKKISVFAASSC